MLECFRQAGESLQHPEGFIGFVNAGFEGNGRAPAECAQTGYVEQLARGAVGLAAVENQFAGESGDLGNQCREVGELMSSPLPRLTKQGCG